MCCMFYVFKTMCAKKNCMLNLKKYICVQKMLQLIFLKISSFQAWDPAWVAINLKVLMQISGCNATHQCGNCRNCVIKTADIVVHTTVCAEKQKFENTKNEMQIEKSFFVQFPQFF